MGIKFFASAAIAAALAVAIPALAQDHALPKQTLNKELNARLPKEIRDAGGMVSVNSGSFPPYAIVSDIRTVTGVSADLTQALSELLGVTIRHESVNGLPAILSGIKSGRFQFTIGPIGDFPERQAANDFVDWVREYVVFAVQKGNPKGIKVLADTCSLKISVQSGGSAERVIKTQAETCANEGKAALEVQSYPDQPTAILAVRSKRADAFFSSQAPLTYFVQQSNGQLELAAVGEANGFDKLYQGMVVGKDSPLSGILLDAMKELFANGTYGKIMAKWDLSDNMIKEPGLNLAGKDGQ